MYNALYLFYWYVVATKLLLYLSDTVYCLGSTVWLIHYPFALYRLLACPRNLSAISKLHLGIVGILKPVRAICAPNLSLCFYV